MITHRYTAYAIALSAMAGGCAVVTGIDDDYHTRACVGLSATCGPKGDESCCAITAVPGGTYDRSNSSMSPATVSDFWLDRFEITVGRFRKFVASYPGSKPMAGSGAHPRIPGSGWDPAWDAKLPPSEAELRAALADCDPQASPRCFATWTDEPGMNEDLPMNSITWFEAFAFCAWDGGRLPTEAEWSYAAVGGSEQRPYPWGETLDEGHVGYDCTEDGSGRQDCALADILPVGSKPAGDGRFGQADLAGSMFEWNLDSYVNTYSATCKDCACINCECTDCIPKPGFYRVLRGGSWSSDEPYLLTKNHSNNNDKSSRLFGEPSHRLDYVGARCARNPITQVIP